MFKKDHNWGDAGQSKQCDKWTAVHVLRGPRVPEVKKENVPGVNCTLLQTGTCHTRVTHEFDNSKYKRTARRAHISLIENTVTV